MNAPFTPMTAQQLYPLYLKHPTICTDTRAITHDCLFFALKGENFDANQYAEQAIHAGAAYVIIDNVQYQKNDRYILVENTLSALQDLARLHRQRLSIPVIGVTGSNGKTTSKELINSVLSQHYRTFATHGNLNNHIGVPLSILSIRPDVEIAIIEMGANHQKEIDFLCSIAQPSHGIITNIGKAHLEGFGGFEGVMTGKGELYAYLKKTKGTAFINQDNPLLLKISRTRALDLEQIIYYGTGLDTYVKGESIASLDENVHQNSSLAVKWQTTALSGDTTLHTAKSNLTGSYNFENILAAICIGHFFGLNATEINAGIEAYHPTNSRSQVTQTNFNTIICDYYNANPTSVSFALDNLVNIDAPNKVIILGDMFELGNESEKEHQIIVQKTNQMMASQRIFIGEEFYKCKDSVNQFYLSTQEAADALNKHQIRHATVLLKGSRGMKLERLMGLL